MSKTKTERALLSGTTECTVRGGRGVGGGGLRPVSYTCLKHGDWVGKI